MPATISHVLSATTPNDPGYEIQPKHWNSGHIATLSAAGSEIIGAFSNLNGISFGTEAGGGVTASYTVPVQSVQTQASGNLAGAGFTSTTTAGVDVKATHGTDGLSWANPAYITTARRSTDAVGLNTAQTSVTWTVNSSGISIDAGAYLTTARRSTDAVGLNTAQTAVTWTVNSSGISIDAGAYLTTARKSTDAVGLNTAQTAVTWTVNSSGISFDAGAYLTTARKSTDAVGLNTALTANGVAWTVNSSGISLNVPAFLTTARASTDAVGLNTAQTNVTWTVNSSGLSFNAGGYAGTNTAMTGGSVTLNTSGISINVADTTISSYENAAGLFASQTMTFNGASVSHAVAFNMSAAGSFSFVRIPVLMSMSTGSMAANASITTAAGFKYSTWNAVAYSMGVGASSNSLVSFASSAALWTQVNSVSAGGGANSTVYSITQKITAVGQGSGLTAGTSTQYSQTAASATLSSGFLTNFSSLRFLDIDWAKSLTAGAYWLIVGYSSSSTTSGQGGSAMTNAGVYYSNHYGNSQVNSWWEVMGATAGSSGGYLGAGSFSTAGGGTTSILPISAISSSLSNNRLYFQMLRSA